MRGAIVPLDLEVETKHHCAHNVLKVLYIIIKPRRSLNPINPLSFCSMLNITSVQKVWEGTWY